MNLGEHKKLSPVIVLAGLMIWTGYSCLNGITDFTYQHAGAILALAICTGIFFLARKYYKYVLLTTLFLGILNILNFTPFVSITSFYFMGIGISFQTITFCVCIFAIIVNWTKKNQLVVVSSERTEVMNKKQFEEDVMRFCDNFEGKESSDLETIINDKRFTPAAVEAAKIILTKRKE